MDKFTVNNSGNGKRAITMEELLARTNEPKKPGQCRSFSDAIALAERANGEMSEFRRQVHKAATHDHAASVRAENERRLINSRLQQGGGG